LPATQKYSAHRNLPSRSDNEVYCIMTIDQRQIEEAVGKARNWRYERHGREAGAVDCVGFAMFVMREAGVDVPDYEYPYGDAGAAYFYEHYHEYFEPVEKGSILVGDLAFMKLPDGRHHMGVYAGGGRLAHCTVKHGVVYQPLASAPLAQAQISFYRAKEANRGEA
jgi:cell wall-associated NlpC family hydrolase